MLRIVFLPSFLFREPYGATVWFPRTIFIDRTIDPSPALIAHELAHVRQLDRLGLFGYWWRYLRLRIQHGYDDHPMEQEARAAAGSPTRLREARELLSQKGLL